MPNGSRSYRPSPPCPLLAPVGAAAETAQSDRRASADFRVILDIGYRNSKPKVVKTFKFKHVRDVRLGAEAGRSPPTACRPHFGRMSVNGNGRFGRVFSNNGQNFDGKIVIRGKFRNKHSLEGTLKIRGDYPNAGYEGCSTGKVEWTAQVG